MMPEIIREIIHWKGQMEALVSKCCPGPEELRHKSPESDIRCSKLKQGVLCCKKHEQQKNVIDSAKASRKVAENNCRYD